MEMAVVENLSCAYFSQLQQSGAKFVVDFCMEAGLITDRYKCPECGNWMKLVERNTVFDGYEWRCRRMKTHDCRRTLRRGSWFSMSRLNFTDILRIIQYWIYKMPALSIGYEVNVSNKTVREWSSFCREVCMLICVKDSQAIGGEGVVVEVDGSIFVKRNFNKGKKEERKWVFRGIEQESTNCFFRDVEERGRDALLEVVRDYIKPGTTIISNYWRAFDCLQDEGFQHLRVDRSLNFKEPENGGHGNTIEGTWAVVKRQLPARLCQGEAFDGYLYEYIWRRKNKHHRGKMMTSFLQAVKEIYPPDTSDTPE